jgi:cytochrome c-type biogenesis protein CcmH
MSLTLRSLASVGERVTPVLCGIALLLSFSLSESAFAVELRTFATPADEARFKSMSAELRCLVCQNQSLADSDADLAQDLRRELHEMITAGQSNDEIKAFMVARYGDFILYNPPFTARTAVLWIAPFVGAPLGILLLIVAIRRNRAAAKLLPAIDDANTQTAARELIERRKRNGA